MLHRTTLTPAERLARAADPILVLNDAGAPPPHLEQARVLRNWRQDHMLLWTRQGGKSTTGAGLACHNLLFDSALSVPPTIIIVSRAERQSGELFRKARSMYGRLPYAPPLTIDSATVMETPNEGRILAYPGSEDAVRGLSAVTLALIDEATLVERELRDAVTPMLSTTNAPVWAMGTAKGRDGWFYEDWHDESLSFIVRSKITYDELAHISAEFIVKESQRMPQWKFSQEYECKFLENGDQTLIDPSMIDAMQNPEVRALW